MAAGLTAAALMAQTLAAAQAVPVIPVGQMVGLLTRMTVDPMMEARVNPNGPARHAGEASLDKCVSNQMSPITMLGASQKVGCPQTSPVSSMVSVPKVRENPPECVPTQMWADPEAT